jgi:flagellar biosynthesis anti-sigma factor FlgM
VRIDSNQAAQPLPEGGPTGNASATNGQARAAASSPLGEDEAQLSGVHAQVQQLVSQASQLPEIRQEKVNALRQVVLGGSYKPAAQQIADAVFAHMLVMPAA